jgi:murein DD-endopeptidase MepM/ murein hydrolase activator NlpD
MKRKLVLVPVLILMLLCTVPILVAGAVPIGPQPPDPNPGGDTSTVYEYFQLSYPISSKWAVQHDPVTGQFRWLDYTSIVDHTSPDYTTSNGLQTWTGEQGDTYGSGPDACGNLSPAFRGYCYNGHAGLDIPVARYTEVRAAHAGVVVRGNETNDWDGTYGKTIFLRDETNPAFMTRYSHLDQVFVGKETHVRRGDVIGLSGCTGGSGCVGDHLHWGLYFDSTNSSTHPQDTAGQVLDPYGWFSRRDNPLGAPVNDYKWAKGYSSQVSPGTPTNDPQTFDFNEGTVEGMEYIDKTRNGAGPHSIGGAAGVDNVEQWWANTYGAAGPPMSDAWYNYQTYGYCQQFEGGQYCPGLYTPWYWASEVPLSYWAHRYIEWGTREGILTGYSDGTVRPNDFVTRQQFSKMVVVAFSFPIYTPPTQTFCDISPTDAQYPYVETLVHQGVIGGYSPTDCASICSNIPGQSGKPCFKPNDNVSRQQMTKFVASAAQTKWSITLDDPSSRGVDYFDIPTDSSFYPYVRTLYDIGAIRYRRSDGDSGCNYGIEACKDMGHFYAGWSATRAQLAQLLHETIYALRPTNR